MKEIALTQGKVAIVDDADFEVLNRHKRQHKSMTWQLSSILENLRV